MEAASGGAKGAAPPGGGVLQVVRCPDHVLVGKSTLSDPRAVAITVLADASLGGLPQELHP